MPDLVVVVGAQVGSITTRTYIDGTADWTANHGSSVFCAAVDSSGNVYTGGVRTGGYTTRKYNSSGSLQWSVDHGDTVYGIAVDSSGNVYTGGWQTGGYTTRKYNSSGSLQWSKDHGVAVNAVCVDSSGNLFASGGRTGSITTRKYDSSGTQLTTVDFGQSTNAVAVDASGNLYLGGYNSDAYATLAKYNSSYTEQWRGGGFPTGLGVAVDSSGNVYGCGNSLSYSIGLRKYNSSGTSQWTRNPNNGKYVNAVAVDSSGNVYCCGERDSSLTVWKYDSSGNQTWTADHGDTAYGIACGTIAAVTSIPALELAISLGTPFQTGFSAIPALALNLALAIPSVSALDPPDLSGLVVQQIYRAYLTGVGSTPYEIPIASLQCRRRLGESTWLNVRVPNWSAPLQSAIIARIGGELVIYSGTRNAIGTEVMGIFLRATLTDCDYSRSPYGGDLQLTARVINPSYTARTRTLTGVSKRSRISSRRVYECDVDPLLRPNDTVTGLGADFTVLSIEYEIAPFAARMTVTEDA